MLTNVNLINETVPANSPLRQTDCVLMIWNVIGKLIGVHMCTIHTHMLKHVCLCNGKVKVQYNQIMCKHSVIDRVIIQIPNVQHAL